MARADFPLAGGAPLAAPTTSAQIDDRSPRAGRCSTPRRSTGRCARSRIRPFTPSRSARSAGRRRARPRMPHHRLRRPEPLAMVCDRDRRLSVDGLARLSFLRFARRATCPRRFERRYRSRPCSTGCRSTARAPGAGRRARRAARPILARMPRAAASAPCSRTGQRDCRGERDDEAQLAYLEFPLAGFGARVARRAGAALHAAARRRSRTISPTASPTAISSMAASAGTGAALSERHAMPPAYVVPVDRPPGVRALDVAPHRDPRRAGRQRHRAHRLSRPSRPDRHPDRPRRAAAHRLVACSSRGASRARAEATPSTA